jgi:uncharacterized protein (DUF58 family)
LNSYTLLLLVLLAILLPPMAAALAMRVFPTGRALFVMGLPAAVSLVLLFDHDYLWLVFVFDLACAGLLLFDLFCVPFSGKRFHATRQIARTFSIDRLHPVVLRVENRGQRRCILDVREDEIEHLHFSPEVMATTTLPGRSVAVFEYQLRPRHRGAFQLEKIYLRVQSLFGLWVRMITLDCRDELHVYPDLRQISQYAALARTNRLSQLGVRRVRRVGQDHDFERLRDYQLDDNYKHIDWTATAKRRKLTVKDFQSNRSQRVLFMLDCGRMMTNESAGLTLLDHSLNAMLMLSYVALRQADAVGLICFSNRLLQYVPPRTGRHQMNRLLHASYDCFAQRVESRYDDAFFHLASRCRKRSLVILISNVTDEVNSHQIVPHLGNLVGSHLPLGVLLRDHRMFDAVPHAEPTGMDLWRAGAAAEILAWRHQVLADLRGRGALTLDVFPEDLTAPLINQYLEIKARHLL